MVILLFFLECYLLLLKKDFCNSVLCKREKGKYYMWIVWGTYFVLDNGITYFLTVNGWQNIAVSLLLLFVTIRILHYDSARTVIYITAFLFFLALAADLITVLGGGLITGNMGLAEIANVSFIYTVISRLLQVAVFKLLSLLKTKRKRGIELKAREWIEIFLIPVLSIALLLAVYLTNYIESENLILFSIACIILINVFWFLIFEKLKEGMEKQIQEQVLRQQIASYSRQYQSEKEKWEELMIFRHDLKQRSLLEWNLLKEKKYDELENYMKQSHQFLMDSKKDANTGNLYFDSIINYKMADAKRYEIPVQMELTVPKDVKGDAEAIYICLGNLLDNAIEASKELPPEERYIKLVVKACENLFLSVENKYGERRERIRNKYVSTKADKRQHGFGMDIVDKIVEKYHGKMEIEDKNNIFKVSILMLGFEE